MAVKKSTGATKTAKKAAPKKTTKATGAKRVKRPVTKVKAAPKKAAGPKLTDAQKSMLSRIADTGESGYVPDKKEQRIVDALLKRKCVKKGKKEPSGTFRYMVTKAGSKVLGPQPAAAP